MTTISMVAKAQRRWMNEIVLAHADQADGKALRKLVLEDIKIDPLINPTVVRAPTDGNNNLVMTLHERHIANDRAMKLGSKVPAQWEYPEHWMFADLMRQRRNYGSRLRMQKTRDRRKAAKLEALAKGDKS